MRLIALILAFVLCFVGSAISDNIATPTDIEESVIEEKEIIEEIKEEKTIEEISPTEELVTIEDEDWGNIEIEFERKVYISITHEPHYIGDKISFVATLIDFQPTDEYIIYWQYSKDKVHWINVENEHKKTFTVTITGINYKYWWRVLVEWRNGV